MHVEAGPNNFKLLQQNRPHSTNINAALCATAGTVHYIEASDFRIDGADAVAGIVEFMNPKFREKFWKGMDAEHDSRIVPIDCMPFTQLMQKHHVSHIDLWVLDVEGAELEVLKTTDLTGKTLQIDILCIELDGNNPSKDAAVVKLLEEHGYSVYEVFPGRNTWFVHEGVPVPESANKPLQMISQKQH